MLDFQQKWKVKSVIYSRYLILLVFFVALYSLYSTYTVYQKKKDSAEVVLEAEQKLFELNTKNTALINSIDRLQTDEGLEAEIRSKYSVVKDQEMVVVLVEENIVMTETDVVEVKKSFFSKIIHFLGL